MTGMPCSMPLDHFLTEDPLLNVGLLFLARERKSRSCCGVATQGGWARLTGSLEESADYLPGEGLRAHGLGVGVRASAASLPSGRRSGEHSNDQPHSTGWISGDVL
jgi:hypothetical protein